ncbi:hypothetical protein RV18_GL002545 [Enterococcus termitis]|nr:hypothetical protein RV18_GL002545 [Enterococcus termitis]
MTGNFSAQKNRSAHFQSGTLGFTQMKQMINYGYFVSMSK